MKSPFSTKPMEKTKKLKKTGEKKTNKTNKTHFRKRPQADPPGSLRPCFLKNPYGKQ